MGKDTYDAIYKIAKSTDSDTLHVFMDGADIKGLLIDCDDNKCVNGIVTLQDASVTCKQTGNTKHYPWLNIPSCYIKAFTFQDCVSEE